MFTAVVDRSSRAKYSSSVRQSCVTLKMLVAGLAVGDHAVVDRRDRRAFAGDLGGDALGDLAGHAVVDQHVELRLAEQVDETGRDDQAGWRRCACRPARRRRLPIAAMRSPMIADVGAEPRRAGAVDDAAVGEDDVVGRWRCGRRRRRGSSAGDPARRAASAIQPGRRGGDSKDVIRGPAAAQAAGQWLSGNRYALAGATCAATPPLVCTPDSAACPRSVCGARHDAPSPASATSGRARARVATVAETDDAHLRPERYYNTFSGAHPPALRIRPGDRVDDQDRGCRRGRLERQAGHDRAQSADRAFLIEGRRTWRHARGHDREARNQPRRRTRAACWRRTPSTPRLPANRVDREPRRITWRLDKAKGVARLDAQTSRRSSCRCGRCWDAWRLHPLAAKRLRRARPAHSAATWTMRGSPPA